MKTILGGDEIANVGLTKVQTNVAWIDELVLFQSGFPYVWALCRLKLNLQIAGNSFHYIEIQKNGVVSLYPGYIYLVLNISCEYLSLYHKIFQALTSIKFQWTEFLAFSEIKDG